MAGKLSWTDLRRALASRAGVSEKKASAFLNAIQVQLIEALKSDKQVKINGLGTFKVQAVAPRKSVNVNTGEEIVIEGYNKLVFTPEAGVKELVEKSKISSVENDPLKKLGEQAEEIVDILGDLGQSPKAPEPPLPEPEPEQETPLPDPVQPKKYHFVRDTLICVVVLLMLLLGGYFFLRHELSDLMQKLVQPNKTEQVTEQKEQVVETEEVVVPAEIEAQPAEAEEVPVAEEAPIVEEAPRVRNVVRQENSNYPTLITTEPMHKASRLAWMAKRYYGAKIYWPYLYDANRDVITNPNKIETGTPIRVPKLTRLQLDTTNAETMATLERLREEALNSGE